MGLVLVVEPGHYALAQLASDAPVPRWLPTSGFVSVTRAADELSIICAQEAVPADIRQQGGWRLIRFVGPFPFTVTGVLSSVLEPLAAAGVSIIATSTFNTDYLLVPADALDTAETALRAAGHEVRSTPLSQS